MLTDRILPPEEWYRLEGELVPLLPHLDPARVVIVVVEEDGVIVGRLVWIKADHVENAWMAPSHRGKAAVARRGWRRIRQLIRESGGKTMMVSANRADMAAMFAKRGVPYPGQEFVIRV